MSNEPNSVDLLANGHICGHQQRQTFVIFVWIFFFFVNVQCGQRKTVWWRNFAKWKLKKKKTKSEKWHEFQLRLRGHSSKSIKTVKTIYNSKSFIFLLYCRVCHINCGIKIDFCLISCSFFFVIKRWLHFKA